MGKGAKSVLGVVGLVCIGALGFCMMDAVQHGLDERAKRTEMDAKITSLMPEAQKTVVDAVIAGRKAYDEAKSDIQRGGARGERARAICAAIRRPSVRGWVGWVETLSSNSDGKGVLALVIGPRVKMATAPNALADIGLNTLIEHSDPTFEQASTLKMYQAVRFSGRLFASDTDCIEEASLTLRGSMQEPDFRVRFSNIEPVAE